jgi:hypothetical protein
MKRFKKTLIVFILISLFLVLGLFFVGKFKTKASDPSLFATQFLQSFAINDLERASTYVRNDSYLKNTREMKTVRDFIANHIGEAFLDKFKISEVTPVENVIDVRYFDKSGREISYMEAFQNAQKEAEMTQEYKDIVRQHGDAMKTFVDRRLKENQPIDSETERLANLGYAKLAELNAKFVSKKEEKKVTAYRVLVEFSVSKDKEKLIYPYITYPVTIDIDVEENGTLRISGIETPGEGE